MKNFQLIFPACLTAALAIAVGQAACSGGGDGGLNLGIGTQSSGSGGSGGQAAQQAGQAHDMFNQLEPQFVSECGACHAIGGPADTPFLGDPKSGNPDPYKTVTSWPNFVVADYKQSRLLTHPVSPDHKGAKPSDGLIASLSAWLGQEAKGVADVSKQQQPTLPPFQPIVPGFNAVYLDPLSPDFSGMALTFQADALTSNALSLTDIEVHPTTQKGLKISHPLFTVFPAGSVDGEPDPVDSFSNVIVDLAPGQSGPLGPGAVILDNWSPGARLSIAFQQIDAKDPNGGGGGGGGSSGGGGGCKAVDSFKANVAPLLANPCFLCHGGTNTAATNAVDMRDLMTDPGKTCNQVLGRVNLQDPPKSQLFVTTDPSGNAAHPYKFGGNKANFNQFETSVTQWIQDEAK